MRRTLALAVLLIVLIVASGCAQNSPPTGNVVAAGNQPQAPKAQESASWSTYNGDLSKDQCPEPAVCLGKASADYKCMPSSWCGRYGDPRIAGNKPYCCKLR